MSEDYDYDPRPDERRPRKKRNKRKRGGGNRRLIEETVGKLTHMLKVGGLPTEVVAVAATGSTYMEFPEHPFMGKIRVGDHNERQRYGYRWQIRVDMKEQDKRVCNEKGHPRYFYSHRILFEAVNHMLNYRRAVERRLQNENGGE